MVAVPFIYFTLLGIFLYKKEKLWGMDIAAVSLLTVISFFAIIIDIQDLYGNFGINEYDISLLGVLLFCIQWTIVILPLNHIQKIPLDEYDKIKKPMLYLMFMIIIASSVILIYNSVSLIKEALIMDMADVRSEHYKDIGTGGGGETNYFLFIPTILCQPPFPTLALFCWFYMKIGKHDNMLISTGLFVASIVQAVLAIVIAGRAAMIYWIFDFYILYSFFYRHISKNIKRVINLIVLVLGTLIGILFITITVSRFDGKTDNRDPLASLYGYAGQHVNNFSTMINEGGDVPILTDRIFPLMTKVTTGKNFELMTHYNKLENYVKPYVNVFDTFGGELYLDLGWFGYILFFILYILFYQHIRFKWESIKLHQTFIVVILVAFFSRGLFAWPFTHHYTTLALLLMLFCTYIFRYKFKL